MRAAPTAHARSQASIDRNLRDSHADKQQKP
jgi:hypothetical protein